eukprot:6930213-Pyramimonas_sp.AAC.1
MTGLSTGCAQPTISLHSGLCTGCAQVSTLPEHSARVYSNTRDRPKHSQCTGLPQAYGQAVRKPVIGLCGACV